MDRTSTDKLTDLALKELTSENIRKTLFDKMLFIFVGLGPFVFIAGYANHANFGYTHLSVLKVISYIAAIFCTITRNKVDTSHRIILMFSIFFIYSTTLLFTFGLYGAGIYLLFSLALFVTILLGIKWGFFSVIFTTSSITIYGFLAYFDIISAGEDRIFQVNKWIFWVDVSLLFFTFCSSIILAAGSMYNLQQKAMDLLKEQSNRLKDKNSQLNQYIEKRKIIEDELANREKRLRLLLKNSNDVIVVLDNNGGSNLISESVTKLTGFTSEELLALDSFSFIHPEDVDNAKAILAKLIQKEGETIRAEFRFKHKDGTWLHAESIGTNFLKEPSVNGIVLNVRDVTERKRNEEKLLKYQERLRFYASELTLTEERARRKISVVLHDKISQNLASINMDVELMRQNMNEDSLFEKADRITQKVDKMISKTRGLIFDLSPPVLYDLGLPEALDSLFDKFGKNMKIPCKIKIDNKNLFLDEDQKVLLYQIVNELLVNAKKYSQASEISGKISNKNGLLTIKVQDNGIGFDPDSVSADHDNFCHFGIFSIKERLKHFGGSIDIKSSPGHGCTSTIKLKTISSIFG